MKKDTLYNKILLVEDDQPLAYIIKKNLERLGYDITVEHDGERGLEQALSNKFALIILDVSLPNITGLDIAAKVKSSDMKTPILIITNYNTTDNELESFRRGANVFHRKPINFSLFETQVQSLFSYQVKKPELVIGEIHIRPEERSITKDHTNVTLSPKEFRLITALASAKGQILSRQDLLAETFKGVRELEEGSIDTLVCRIRKKLKELGEPKLIKTVHGGGYCIHPKFYS